MDLKNLAKLEEIEKYLQQIRTILNPEDSPYVCDTIVSNINDPDLSALAAEMMAAMGYKKSLILKIVKIIKKIQN